MYLKFRQLHDRGRVIPNKLQHVMKKTLQSDTMNIDYLHRTIDVNL